jgi:molybdate transport system substrate-binding protein
VGRRYLLFILGLFLLLSVFGCSNKWEDKKQETGSKQVELTVSAAASLQDVLTEIKANFEKDHSNIKIVYNFGASGALQQQISQGAPVDLFFSAAEDQFNQLVQKGLIRKNNETNLVGNQLVLIVPRFSHKEINTFEDLNSAAKIAIGSPEVVPAGKYAKETLQNLKLWNSIEGKIVPSKDVRQVLTYVETGNVDAGIVYKTDALHSSKVKIAASANESSHSPIIYPVGVIQNRPHFKEAQIFYNYLQQKKSIKTFERYGFRGLKN